MANYTIRKKANKKKHRMTGAEPMSTLAGYTNYPENLNTFLHDPDITNLHTHGLHVSPEGFFCDFFF